MDSSAYRFTPDPTEDQAQALARHFGARRKAYNWTVAALKADIQEWRATGIQTAKPSLRVLRKRWNTVKNEVCVNPDTGKVWWPECSKEAFADGIDAAVDGYWNWQQSRSGKRAGKRVGFPRFTKKGRDRDRVTFTTGAIRVEPDRRHVTLPVIGSVRVHENTRRMQRLLARGGPGFWRSPYPQGNPAHRGVPGAGATPPTIPSVAPTRFSYRGRCRGAECSPPSPTSR